MSKPIVLVTGATSYLGSHVVHQLLEQSQYIVRATVRPGKVSNILHMFPNAGSNLQIAEVASLTADHSEALKDVYAILHVASPSSISRNVSGRELFEGTYHGTYGIVDAAIKANVKKIVATGSLLSLVEPDLKAGFGTEPLTEKSFGSATRDDAHPETEDLVAIYHKAKTAAEKKIWELAHQHPDIDITVFIPPVILGPQTPNHPFSAGREGWSTMDYVYQLITSGNEKKAKDYPPVPIGHMIDVRDAAKAHIMGLTVSPLKNRDKRFLIASNIFTWKGIADLLRRERPELASRLPPESAIPLAQTNAPYDTTLTEEVLGLKAEMYIPWEKTIVDTIDEILRWEHEMEKSQLSS